jgi:GntR family transcriptional regulator
MRLKTMSLHTNIPAYILIESVLRNKILSGQLEPGQKMAKEEDLALQFSVSRITIRTALSNLEAEDLIVRKRAKGTFVSENIPIKKQFIVTGYNYGMVLNIEMYDVKPLGIQDRKVNETRIPRDIADFFALDQEATVSVVRRIRQLDGVPVYYLENFLSPAIAQHVTLNELSAKSMLKTLKETLGVSFGKSEADFESVPADADVASILQCHLFSPLIQAKVYYRLQSGEPFQITLFFMRPEYFKFKLEFDVEKMLWG